MSAYIYVPKSTGVFISRARFIPGNKLEVQLGILSLTVCHDANLLRFYLFGDSGVMGRECDAVFATRQQQLDASLLRLQ